MEEKMNHKEENYELCQDYLKLIEPYIPSIKNIHEWEDIQNFDATGHRTNSNTGLISSYYLLEQKKFFKRKFGINNDLDNHIMYFVCVDMIKSVNMSDIFKDVDKIVCNLLCASESQQNAALKLRSLCLDIQQKNILYFFFKRLKTVAFEILMEVGSNIKKLEPDSHKSYELVKTIATGKEKTIRKKHIIKTIIQKLM